MKRKAILIGNSRGLLATQIDLVRFSTFLMSYQGGAWEKDEIELWKDKDVNALMTDMDSIRNEGYDYVIVYFTGHGGLQGETILEVNPKCEKIKESSLLGLASRQLVILDCCRDVVTTPLDIYDSSRSISPIEGEIRKDVRVEYEELLAKATPQLVRLYSCAEDESSYPSSFGSYYSINLIECSKELLKSIDIARIYKCHESAAMKTTADVLRDLKKDQHPVIIPTKCLAETELPFCFNPVSLK